MIKIENVEVCGFEHAVRGMRNAKNSWNKSDSFDKFLCEDSKFHFGGKDLQLAKTLAKAGTDHGKFLRMIAVWCDITAPLYWWKEFDTYKVGTVANSCSTMHKIQSIPITAESFSFDHVKLCDIGKEFIAELEKLRCKFNVTKDKKYWYALIQLLPSSYNQLRTISFNYAVLRNMYHARKTHKLDEWKEFCKWIETLPYSELITEI